MNKDTTATAPELLPCPSGHPAGQAFCDKDPKGGFYCMCGAEDCAGWRTHHYPTKREAIAAWNARSVQSQPVAESAPGEPALATRLRDWTNDLEVNGELCTDKSCGEIMRAIGREIESLLDTLPTGDQPKETIEQFMEREGLGPEDMENDLKWGMEP